jgi:hypothetical protein
VSVRPIEFVVTTPATLASGQPSDLVKTAIVPILLGITTPPRLIRNPMTRTPPAEVRRQLRQEVGFSCPMEGCENPYLTWHHFDPPWRIENHHRPEGMIALCLDHAAKADAGAFTDDRLRTLKKQGGCRVKAIRGSFDWMRRDLLAVVGGSFYYQSSVIFQINNKPCIWFNRDAEGYLLLNFQMPSISGEARARIEDNGWIVPPDAADVVCPPRGRILEVRYANDDRLKVEFFSIDSQDALAGRYPDANVMRWASELIFPSTGVEISERVSGTSIEFGPRSTRIGGLQVVNGFMVRIGEAAIQLNVSTTDLSLLHIH